MKVVRKIFAICIALFFLVACSGESEPEQVYIIVTATPAPNELVVRMTFTPVPAAIEQPTVQAAPTRAATVRPIPSPTPATEGLPAPIANEIFIAEQEFERARFFWLEPAERTQSIWVLFHEDQTAVKGKWNIFEDTFEEGEMSRDPNIVPPEGFQQPIRGFGKLWRNDPALREEVGWALQREFGYVAEYRYEYGGEMVAGEYIAGPGIHYLTTRENETYRLDESNFTWSLMNR